METGISRSKNGIAKATAAVEVALESGCWQHCGSCYASKIHKNITINQQQWKQWQPA